MDSRYRRDERLFLGLAAGLAIFVGVLALLFADGLGGRDRQLPPETVWKAIRELAPKRGLDPEFVYALAWAESSLRPKARSSVARGLMQMTKSAWSEVSEAPYRQAWRWRTNLGVAIDYLAFCRDFLEGKQSFSYPLLAACFRYGPYYVQQRDFELARLQPPKNEIYKRIFSGDTRPVAPP